MKNLRPFFFLSSVFVFYLSIVIIFILFHGNEWTRVRTNCSYFAKMIGVFAEVDLALAGALFALDSSLGRHDAKVLLVAVDVDAPRLPPLVVGRVRHVQDVAVVEVETFAGQTAVLGRIVVEQCSHVQALLVLLHECAATRRRQVEQRIGATAWTSTGTTDAAHSAKQI